MALEVGYHATYVVHLLIAVLGWVLGGIVLEDPQNALTTIAFFCAHFCFLLGGILRPRNGLLADLSWPIVSPEPPTPT